VTVNTRAFLLVERNVIVYRRAWLIIASGFFEPVFYLLSIGVGLGTLVGQVVDDGRTIDYTSYVAPGLLAASAMNGVMTDVTSNIFWRLRYGKAYEAMLATPIGVADVALGEILVAVMRGVLYAAGFLVVMVAMGLIHSWWALLALPAATLVAFAFAAFGLALTTFMRHSEDARLVQLALLPLFLFSTTFYPLSEYAPELQVLVEVTPLYHGIELLRALSIGTVDAGLLGHVAYLAAMCAISLSVATRRLHRRLRI
jgi:lipooligosaccharide transport system permease protein